MNGTIDQKKLDVIFEAFGHQHRRDIIYSLGLQPYSISQLAKMQHLSLPAIHKHIKILKDSGLVKVKKIGRTNVLTLNRATLRSMQEWLLQFQAHWGNDEETLENYSKYINSEKKKGGLPLRSPMPQIKKTKNIGAKPHFAKATLGAKGGGKK